MNYLKLASAILAVSFTSQISAQNYQFIAADKSPETQFCVNVANNDIDTMRGELLRMGLGDAIIRNINTLTCNGLPAAKFAYKYNAADTFKYLNNRSSPSNSVKPSVTISDLAKSEASEQPITVYVSAR